MIEIKNPFDWLSRKKKNEPVAPLPADARSPSPIQIKIISKTMIGDEPTRSKPEYLVQPDSISCFSYAIYNATLCLMHKAGMVGSPPFTPQVLHNSTSHKKDSGMLRGAVNDLGMLDICNTVEQKSKENNKPIFVSGLNNLAELLLALAQDDTAVVYLHQAQHECAVTGYDQKNQTITLFDSLTGREISLSVDSLRDDRVIHWAIGGNRILSTKRKRKLKETDIGDLKF